MGFKDEWKKMVEAGEAEKARKDEERRRREIQEHRQKKADAELRSSKISDVGDRSSGVLACPKCGGTQFKAKRSAKSKALLIPTVGVGALLAPKSKVRCETCGSEYVRG